MSNRAKKLMQEVLSLPRREIIKFLADLREAAPHFASKSVEAAWDREIKRRLEELESGKVKPVPHDRAMRTIFGRRRAKRAT